MSTSPPTTSHENRLARETSPYLLQHKHNPVDWWPWGPDALAEAKRANKPILLSVGYAACHWCHVMAHESFEDDATARGDERAVRQHQSRPRGASRHRPDLHVGAASSRRAGRLAADHVPHAGRRAGLGRHLFPEDLALRQARLRRCAARSRARFPRGAGKHRAEPQRADGAAGRDARGPQAQVVIGAPRARPRRAADRRADRPGARRHARRAEIPAAAMLEFLWRAGQRMQRRSATSAPVELIARRACARAASTTISAAASRATRSTNAGWCRISRRCSTTTRSCSNCSALAYAAHRQCTLFRSARARDRRLAQARDDDRRRARSAPRSMPIPKARRASSTSGRWPRSRPCSDRTDAAFFAAAL